MPNLLTEFDPTISPIQLVPHHGLPDYAKGISDSCMTALQSATAGEKKEGGNMTEINHEWINQKPYVIHDATSDQQTLPEGPWSRLPYNSSNLSIIPLQSCIWDLLSRNSAATIFLNAQNDDGAKLVTLISNIPAFKNNVLVQIHPYVFRDGSEFVNMVTNFTPAIDWKYMVAIVPVLDPDTLPMLAHTPYESLDYDVLYNAGQAWIVSMVETQMRIFGLGFPLSGIGHGVNLNTCEIYDLDNNLVTAPHIKAIFLWDRVLLDLVTWAKKTYPALAIVMVSVTYSCSYDGTRYTNSFHIGHPIKWPEGVESHGRELMAIPGNPLWHGANIIICDRMNDNLNAVLGTKTYTWPDDVDYATRNVRRMAQNTVE
ncbi:hypothetical protein JVU11DRAFT_8371 [Chiua virens]|nr:hypothetical protein JVU11DRAFT_8371 [Chiua virens]